LLLEGSHHHISGIVSPSDSHISILLFENNVSIISEQRVVAFAELDYCSFSAFLLLAHVILPRAPDFLAKAKM
jgi:hypothetical protein